MRLSNAIFALIFLSGNVLPYLNQAELTGFEFVSKQNEVSVLLGIRWR